MRKTTFGAMIVLMLFSLLPPPAAATTICLVNCTVEVSTPPEPGAGVNLIVGSEHVYLWGCNQWENVYCIRSGGLLGTENAYAACPTGADECYAAIGWETPGAGNVFLGVVPVYAEKHPCLQAQAFVVTGWLTQTVLCVPHDYDVDTTPTNPSVCTSASIEDDYWATAPPMECTGLSVDDSPACVVVLVQDTPVEVVCEHATRMR